MRSNILLLMALGFSLSTVAQSNSVPKLEEESTEEQSVNEVLNKEEISTTDAVFSESILLEYRLNSSENFKGGVKSLSTLELDELNSLSERASNSAPGSYADVYLRFKATGFSTEGLELLKEAESITANKAELYSDFIATGHLLDDVGIFSDYTEKLNQSGFINEGVREFSKNVLRSLTDKNAFIITNGWDDTYPLLTEIAASGEKRVRVVNVEWLFDINTRKQIAKELGSPNVQFNLDPYAWLNTVVQASAKNVYYSTTLPPSELRKVANSLTPVGLLLKKGNMQSDKALAANLSAWKKFSKLHLLENYDINKNYALPLTILSGSLKNEPKEIGTLEQVDNYLNNLYTVHPEIK